MEAPPIRPQTPPTSPNLPAQPRPLAQHSRASGSQPSVGTERWNLSLGAPRWRCRKGRKSQRGPAVASVAPSPASQDGSPETRGHPDSFAFFQPLLSSGLSLTTERVLAVVANGALGARSSFLVGLAPLHVPPEGESADAGEGPLLLTHPHGPQRHNRSGAHGAANSHKLLAGDHRLPGILWLTKSDLPSGRSQLPGGTGPAHSVLELYPGLFSPRGHLRGLIVAHQQMDVGFLHPLERLTEVGTTANPLRLAPDYLKEDKPSRLALGWGDSPCPAELHSSFLWVA